MKIWIILQLAIDIAIFFIIIGYVIREGKKKNTATVNDNILQVTDSLKEIVTDSENISFRLAKRISEGKKMIVTIDERIKEAEILIEDGKNSTLSASTEKRYKLVSRFAKEGLGNDEIAKRAGISEGEVELIVNLSGESGTSSSIPN